MSHLKIVHLLTIEAARIGTRRPDTRECGMPFAEPTLRFSPAASWTRFPEVAR